MSDVIWVDSHDKVLGEVSRDRAHAEGLLHRIAVTYLVNDKGEILIKERASDKTLDHSSAAHVNVGEEYLNAALRGLIEELRVHDIALTEIGESTSRTVESDAEGQAVDCKHMFKIFTGVPLSLQPNLQEVKGLYWASPYLVFADMQEHPEKYQDGFKKSLEIYLNQLA